MAFLWEIVGNSQLNIKSSIQPENNSSVPSKETKILLFINSIDKAQN